MSGRDGGQGKIRLVGLVAFAACVVEGGSGGDTVKDRRVEGSMRVDTTVLASEDTGGGVNDFSGGICCKCNSTS